MVKQRKWPWFLFLAWLVFGTTVLASLNASHQGRQPQNEVDLNQFPIADYSAPLSKDPSERARREAKSKKYNSKYAPRITDRTDQVFYISDWDVRLPALPVAKSAAIVIGEVTEAHAFLSQDQTDIYSEFSIQIEQVLKSEDQSNSASVVIAERKGGRLRLPSGKIAISRVNHQAMPRIGGRYLFFLTHSFPKGGKTEDFYLLTGYELRGGDVFPLDRPPVGHPILTYSGVREATLLTDLHVALTQTK
jgi:hypothetical protein